MRYAILFLTGCGSIDITYDTNPCENVDLSSDADVYAARSGEDINIYRMPVFVGDTSILFPNFRLMEPVFLCENNGLKRRLLNQNSA